MKKSVLFIANGYPSDERPWKCPFNHRAVKSLQPLCQVTVLAVRAWLPWRIPRQYTYEGVKVLDLLVSPIGANYWVRELSNQNILRRLLRNIMLMPIALKIRKIAKNADLIHSIGIGQHSLVAQRIAEQYDIPHFVQLIGSDVTCLDPIFARSVFFQTWAKKITGYIANSRSLAENYEIITGLNLQIKTVYRGVDSNVFYPVPINEKFHTSSEFVFIYLGGNIRTQFDRHGTDNKGADVLLRAWQIVEKESKMSLTLLVGGPHIEPLGFKNFQNSLKYPDRVSNLGALSSQEIPKILRRVDVLIIPSRKEGLPNICLEAMASGVTVIATQVGGISEVIQSEIDGILVPSENPRRLADAVISLTEDIELINRLSLKAREKVVTNFDSNKYGINIFDVYNIPNLDN